MSDLQVIEQTDNKTLFAKMARIMSKIGRLKKTGRNTFHNYDFATESDVADTMSSCWLKKTSPCFPI